MNPSLPEAWQTPPLPRWRRKLGAYLRLTRADRPIGWLLLLWPTWWGLWFAAGGMPEWHPLVVFDQVEPFKINRLGTTVLQVLRNPADMKETPIPFFFTNPDIKVK